MVRAVCWAVATCAFAFGAFHLVAGCLFFGDIARWAREPSATLILDLATTGAVAEVPWHQECDAVCTQALVIPAAPSMGLEELERRTRSLGMQLSLRDSAGRVVPGWPGAEQIGDGRRLTDDGVHMMLLDPPPNGEYTLRAVVTAPADATATLPLQVHVVNELCGIERLAAAWFVLVGGVCVVVGLAIGGPLFATRRPSGHIAEGE